MLKKLKIVNCQDTAILTVVGETKTHYWLNSASSFAWFRKSHFCKLENYIITYPLGGDVLMVRVKVSQSFLDSLSVNQYVVVFGVDLEESKKLFQCRY